MYVRTTKRENKSGTVRYLHLAHNEWDPAKGRSVPKVLFTFGRDEQLDRDAVKRLVTSLSKLLEPGDALAASTSSNLEFTTSVPFGGTYVLDHLWHRLKIDQIVGRIGQPKRGRRRDMTATERVLFARYADTGETAVKLLEHAVNQMQRRAARYSGKQRSHTPSRKDPFVLVLLDEASQVDMVLGEDARERGAEAPLIDSALPGLAYVRVEGSPSPVRVRAAFPTDADITAMADGYGSSGAVES